MSNFISAVKTFAADENGVTAIEYGLIASLVGVGIVVAATALGGKLSDMFDFIGSKLKTA
ncbi:Flp family type IVb pilin [Massilia sp. 9096]|jgi:pilus assembly protein Flp/PilA|uniref:Flp family type IVb pilin n=1 Tax=Massilia sp. 9096 TaxID=1500894 RepID=UPI000569A9F8|nr:Flp family type IVb pilin [Massilia sp. 9096]